VTGLSLHENKETRQSTKEQVMNQHDSLAIVHCIPRGLILTFCAASCASSPEVRKPQPAVYADTTPVQKPDKVYALTSLPKPVVTDPTPQSRLGTLPENIGLSEGQSAPDAKVRDANGRLLMLSSLYAQGPVLIVFYRGGWCPSDNYQIQNLSEMYSEFQQLGVKPVLISVDAPTKSAIVEVAYDVPFPIISDSDLNATKAFEVSYKLSQDELTALNEYDIDPMEESGRSHNVVAIPSAFLVHQGKVLWSHADQDYTIRPTVSQLVSAIAQKIKK